MIAQKYKNQFFLGGCAILFLACSLLLYHAVPNASSHLDIDSVGYDIIATHFADTHNLSDPRDMASAPIQPVGYPLFLGLIYASAGHDYAYVVFAQLLVLLMAGWILCAIAQQLFNRAVALLSVALCLVTLGFFIYPQFLLAEVLCLFFILGFFERFLSFMRTGLTNQLWQAGLPLGISVLVKPMALLYIFCLLPVLIFYKHKKYKWVHACLILTISFYAPIISYMSYNYYRYNRFALAPMTELNMYQCFLSKVIAHVDGVPVQQVLDNQLAFKGAHTFDSAGWDGAKKLFFKYVRQHPLACVRVWLTNVTKTLVGLYSTQLKVLLEPSIKGGDHSFFKISGTYYERAMGYIMQGTTSAVVKTLSFFEVVWSIIRWMLVFIAFFVLLSRKYYMICWLFGSFIAQSAFVTGMDGCCRYRIMFEPLLIILAAVGIVVILAWIESWRINEKSFFSRQRFGFFTQCNTRK